MSKLYLLSAHDLVEAYRKRSLSPVEVTRSCLDRITSLDGKLNAFCLVDGVPTSIKDLFLTKKWPTMRGSLTVSREQSCDVDAPPVARLREQGAVFLGKTTTTEFGHKGVGDCPLTGITRNPWNTGLTPGGSSCGAGVAAAAAMAPLNLGSDGGGSIRIPASFCGVFGIKPGYGRVPGAPASVAGSLPASGPLTRTVADAALMLQVIAGDDSRDWTSIPEPGLDLLGQLDSGVSGLRIAYAPTIGTAPVTAEVAAAVGAAAETFRSLGATVDEVELDLPGAVEAYYTILSVTLGSTLDGFSEAQRALVDPGLLILADDGRRLNAFDYARALHVARAAVAVTLRQLHERYDLLLLPSMPRTAFPVGEDSPGDKGGEWRADWTPFSFPFNLSGQPACSIPCGLSPERLPIGLQIVGRVRDEALVLRAARAFETTRHFPSPSL